MGTYGRIGRVGQFSERAEGRGAGSVADEIGGRTATASKCVLRTLKAARDALTGNLEVAGHHGQRQAVVADGEVANSGARVEDAGFRFGRVGLRPYTPFL
jgi:hypothetical protein